MNVEQKEKMRPLTESIMIMVMCTIVGMLINWLSGNVVIAAMAVFVTGAQMAIIYRIDKLERNLINKVVGV